MSLVTDVLSNDSDLDPSDVISVTSLGSSRNGTTAISPANQVVYTPALNFNGTDTFTYTISDGYLTDIAVVTISVTPVNDGPPTANDDMGNALDNIPVVVDVLANDTTAPDVNETLMLTAATQPLYGTVTLSGTKQIMYMSAPSFNGVDVFTYVVSHGYLTDTLP